MPSLDVTLAHHHYKIHIDTWSSKLLVKELKRLTRDKIFIITNATIAKLYKSKLESTLNSRFQTQWIVIPDGEQHKTLKTCERIHLALSKNGAHRKSILIAFGGGVVGDITGFVAATYMRGIRYVQIPTTLLAQVDSSVGGKTGVDLQTGKNLVGAFHQPHAVLIFTDFLKTLPKRELRCGLAEVIKYGVIHDRGFFDFLSLNSKKILQLDPKILTRIIRTCCAIKAQIVEQDEKENGLRATLNFGHTLGHAIETTTDYKKFKHGEAVAIGMVFALFLSHQAGVASVDHSQSLTNLLKTFGLPTHIPNISITSLMTAMNQDKKKSGKNLRFILVSKIGTATIKELESKVVRSCLQKSPKKSQ